MMIPREQLQSWNDEGVVEWWGARSDMPEVYARSTIVCLPSYREGLPTVLVEAGACQRAVVTTKAPGCSEIVKDGVNGLWVPVRDANALAGAIVRLLEDTELRHKLAAGGRKLVERDYSYETIVGQTLDVFSELMSEQSSRRSNA
jgi:glycosyltransferase involved in cell wall biosynthesis